MVEEQAIEDQANQVETEKNNASLLSSFVFISCKAVYLVAPDPDLVSDRV